MNYERSSKFESKENLGKAAGNLLVGWLAVLRQRKIRKGGMVMDMKDIATKVKIGQKCHGEVQIKT